MLYPIALYYSKRAPYLCAFGQTPTELTEIKVYNFRLDRMANPEVIHWPRNPQEPTALPAALVQCYWQQQLPTPLQIRQAMDTAWGFDVGRAATPLILRFEAQFHETYIHDSDRHDTFVQLVKQHEVVEFLEDYEVPEDERQRVYERMIANPDDAFYCALFRDGENNIVMRLRAWGPKVEVLYPPTLRTQMQTDLRQALAMYQEVM